MRWNRLVFGAVLPALFWAGAASAVGSRSFELDTIDKLSGGDLKAASVSSDGVVRAGWSLGSVALPDAGAVWSLLQLQDGSVLAGVTDGKVMRIAEGRATLFADTGSAAVTSLALGAGGAVYAGTIPDGKVFKISQGTATLFATLPDVSNIWALAYDRPRATLYAAVGPEGKIIRIAGDGTSSVLLATDEPNLVAVAVGPGGEVYAGSAGRGLLYRITGPGRASVIYDFPGDTATEVRAIALSSSGVLYALDNEYSEPPEPAKRTAVMARAAPGPSTAARPKPGKGSLYRFDAKDRPERMMHHDDFHYMSLALDAAGHPYVGTGAEGRVYTVDDAHVVTLLADTDQRQIGALLVSGGDAKAPLSGYVGASDPAVIHRITGRGGAESVWTSKPLDAGLRARFGRLSWRATGAVELSTRTGNTATPDATWSAWTAPLANATPIQSPPARFIQVRARWSADPNAALSDVIVPFTTENLRPVVLEVGAQSRAGGPETKEGLPSSGAEPPKHDSVLRVTWKVDNPDNDQLRYRVTFRREGQNQWREVVRGEEVFTKSEVEWDTVALPEGKYRLRVEASDEIANPPEIVQKHALESPPVVVDNTPPVFRALSLAGRRLRAKVVDGVGPIVRVELSVDGRAEWRPLAAADGVFDSADEDVDSDVSALVPPGSHIVTVRAFDQAGNSVSQELESP